MVKKTQLKNDEGRSPASGSGKTRLDLGIRAFLFVGLIACSVILPSANAAHRWSNPLTDAKKLQWIKHATFRSPSMGIDVGYCINFPPEYEESKKRFPVIYICHGGQHASDERRHTDISAAVRAWRSRRRDPESAPFIYVFVNGGVVSFYDYPAKKSMGESVFVKELIPHIDKTYRTIADRTGRGLEGYSGGGRATARIGFGFPDVFGSCVAGSGGYNFEKLISETGERGAYKDFLPGHNAYDRARQFAKTRRTKLPIMIVCGKNDPYFHTNVDYAGFLDALKVPHVKFWAEGVGHGPKAIYPKFGREVLKFHKLNLSAPR